MEPAELMAVVENVEAKRTKLMAALPEARESAQILTLLPRAAEEYRVQIDLGLDGDPVAAARGRVILRDLFGGKITMSPRPHGSLWGVYALHPAALLQAGGPRGSGGALR